MADKVNVMAELQRGQVVDYNYINSIVQNLNNVITTINSKSGESEIFMKDTGTTETTRTANAIIVTGYASINLTNVTIGQTAGFNYTFPNGFKETPIVVASPAFGKDASSTAANNVSVVVTSTDTNSMTGIIKFHEAGAVSVGVNIIAIGYPNS